MEYKKYYEECTGKKIPKNFHIHHINHDRDDNGIDNLVAIPSELHTRYHTSFSNEKGQVIDITLPNKNLGFFQMQGGGTHILSVYEISLWIVYREYLIGNFHLIKNGYEY